MTRGARRRSGWRPQDWSLRVKLTLGYALVFGITVLLGAVLVYFLARSSLTYSLDATLRETASVAQGSIENSGGRWTFSGELRPSGDLSIELLSGSGRVLASGGQEDDGLPLLLRPGVFSAGERRVLILPVEGGLFLRVSRPSDTLVELLETLARILVGGSVLMIGVACGAGYLLADRALRPMDAVARTAEGIARRGRYQERVPAAPGRDEMARLTSTVNAMLDGLEGTIEREKSFARTAAHELRTPLTVLKGRLDLTLERPREAAEYARALNGMRGRVEALVELSESLLALARTDAPVHLQRVELAGSAVGAVDMLEEAAHRVGKRVRLDVQESWVQAEQEGVNRALVNLIENALKYGAGDVVVQVQERVVTVLSAGPGPDRQQWPRLLEPFERGPGAQGTPGSGLGLPLVAALAQRWDAELLPRWKEETFGVSLRFPT
ncbi:sensor histidine kinase [Deinococcus aquaticus]|uniref:sensor histidine kinase n=1 Tax=Deinococcus aquaticus TaxID=328692 RepID=UPI003F4729DE